MGVGQAVFSEDRRYRYWLERDVRTLRKEDGTLSVVMLNPSTADETHDDPTIRRCMGFARRWGYGRLIVVNIFGFRATNPDELTRLFGGVAPVGPENDDWIRQAIHEADRGLVAWGAWKGVGPRERAVASIFQAAGVTPLCLGTTKDGHPRHPLYVAGETEPRPWTEERRGE